MTTPSLDFHPRAMDEVRAARRWYHRRSAALGQRFLAALDHAARQIESNPTLGSPHLHGTRYIRLRRFPFLIVYLETISGILVVAVAHARRKPGYWRRRTR